MKTIFKKMILAVSALLLVVGVASVSVPVSVYAQDCTKGVGKGVSLASDGKGCKDKTSGEGSFANLIKQVINIFSIVVGAISVIMIIIGGFRYIVSAGDSNAVTGAKNTILYAIVGLVIVLFAQIIVRFVLTNALKTT